MSSKVTALITNLSFFKTRKEEIEEELKVINKELEEISKRLLPEAMEEEGIENIKVAGVGRVYLQSDLYIQVPKDQREAFYNWLEFTGRESMVTETVNPMTLKAAVKEWLKNGEEIPEDLIKIKPYTFAKLTRA